MMQGSTPKEFDLAIVIEKIQIWSLVEVLHLETKKNNSTSTY